MSETSEQRFDRLMAAHAQKDSEPEYLSTVGLKARCALCRADETTSEVYGLLDLNIVTRSGVESTFHLCRNCVPVFYADAEALGLIGYR